jgi:DnaJ-class molecular chaperone
MRTVHAGPSFYDTLQVSPRASAPVIKAAFRCLAQLNHPDKNLGDDTAADRLMAVVKAYLVLSDPEQRRTYDLTSGASKPEVERRGTGRAAANHSRSGDSPQTGMRPFAFRPLD